jgi:AraC-like DNA-binding protein
MELKLYDILRFITVFLFFFFTVFLFTLKKGNRVSNILLAIFLLSKSLCFGNGLLFRFKYAVIDFSPHVFLIGESFEYLLGPALYLYARSLSYSDFKLKKIYALHLIPFIAHFTFMFFKFHMYSSETKTELLSSYLFSYPEYILYSSAMQLHFIIYSAITLFVLFSYRKELKNHFSSLKKIKLSWLEIIVSGFIVLWGSYFIVFILNLMGLRLFYPQNLSLILLFTFANIILYKGLKQPEIFAGIKQSKPNGKPMLNELNYNRYLKQLEIIMENEKPFLNPSLSLNGLAAKIKIPTRYLSDLINRSFNQNFFDFINTYRIEEAKKMLTYDNDGRRTVLEVLYESGFNSKSAFNNAFKRNTGITPTEYRKHQATA